MINKYNFQSFNSVRRGNIAHNVSMNPFRVGVNYKEGHAVKKGAKKIQMNSTPWLARFKGCSGATLGSGHDCWQTEQVFTSSSICVSMPGHQIYARASAFILLIPE